MGPRERVRHLREEIKQLSTANQVYLKKRSRSPAERFAQQMRGQRLKQIIDDLAQIANQRSPKQARVVPNWADRIFSKGSKQVV